MCWNVRKATRTIAPQAAHLAGALPTSNSQPSVAAGFQTAEEVLGEHQGSDQKIMAHERESSEAQRQPAEHPRPGEVRRLPACCRATVLLQSPPRRSPSAHAEAAAQGIVRAARWHLPPGSRLTLHCSSPSFHGA